MVKARRFANVFEHTRQASGICHHVYDDFVPYGMALPTDAAPGSPEKIAEMCRRLELGYPLWNPRDNLTLDRPNNTACPDPVKMLGQRGRKGFNGI